MKKLVIATHNPGKVQEFKALLTSLPLVIVGLDELAVPEPEETGLSYVENAILKARHAAKLTGLPALADDSGLSVDYLNGAPGIYSARYAGGKDSQANIRKLLSEMQGVPDSERVASFYCVLALMQHANDPTPLVFQGQWQGRILTEMKGAGGFGYDPVFYVPTQHCSAAELDKTTKNAISHRAQAFQQLITHPAFQKLIHCAG
jgi:XTP/dITP diphosphohydrolase